MAPKKKVDIEKAADSRAAQKGMRIIAMQADNIKRVSCVRIRPKGNMVVIAGPNGSGKTSILESIAWALTGERGIPSQPIKKGQNAGRIQVDLGDYKVTRTFTRINGGKEPFLTRLEVTGKNKEIFRGPQDLMNRLRSVISFDPLSFAGLEGNKQLEMLRKLVKFDIDLDAHDQKRKGFYDARRDAGRDLDQQKARLAALVEPEEGTPTEPVDLNVLAGRLGEAVHANEERMRQMGEAQAIAQLIVVKESQVESKRAELSQLMLELNRLNGDTYGISVVSGDGGEIARLAEQLRAIQVPEEVDTDALRAEISAAVESNRKVLAAQAYRRHQELVREAEALWEDHDKQVKELDKIREAALARARMPIEGLSIGDGEVLYDGLPLSQASAAERIRVCVAMAMATNPDLRVLRIVDGALLDKASMAMIEKMAEEHDFQVWIERVEPGEKVGIIMEDGEASGEDVEKVQ